MTTCCFQRFFILTPGEMESNLTLTNIFADGLGCINHQQKMRRFNGRDRRLTKTNQRIFVGLKPPGSRGWMAVLGGKT